MKSPVVRELSILVLEEKHGNLYFRVDNDTMLFRVALAILKGRFNSNYWYYEPEKPEPLDYNEEDITKMPTSMQPGAKKSLNFHQQKVTYYKREMQWWDNAKKAIVEENGALAWQCLRDRNDCEYENIRLVTFDDPHKYAG